MEATFGDGQTHELNVSTYQMCILMLFNTADKLSYGEIEKATGIRPKDLKQNLQSLSCMEGQNVLRKEPMSKNISEADLFHFNDNFSSQDEKVEICTAVAEMESEKEQQIMSEKVEEDRTLAAIVEQYPTSGH